MEQHLGLSDARTSPQQDGERKISKGQGKAQERIRSARAKERRILRGAAKRAEGFLNTTVEEASGTTNRPDHNELDYMEGLRLQAVPEQEVPEFLDVNRTVVGGLPTHSTAGGATKCVWGKFEKDYPSLAKVVQSTPGGKARKFAQEEGGRRVAQGLVAPRAQVVPTTLPPPEQRGRRNRRRRRNTRQALDWSLPQLILQVLLDQLVELLEGVSLQLLSRSSNSSRW